MKILKFFLLLAAEKQKGYRGWWAAFEFKEDGKWYCIQFVSMSDFGSGL